MTDFSRQLLLNDVGLLNEAGCEDSTLATLAGDHAARVKTLIEAIQCPSYGRALALTMAQVLLDTAKGIDEITVQEPELVNVG